MRADDREKLFWYLKRKTSYTAWARLSDSFDDFARIFEKQAREEPVAKPESACFETCWEPSLPEVQRAQVLFEKGLAALRGGDRTVWLYNERGILDDAKTILGHWYTLLVNHGMHGDIWLNGKYVTEMTDAICRCSKFAHDIAQVVQPRIAETPAPYAWTTYWEDDFAALPVPATLDEVPVPETEVLVRTGKIAPVFGIYEPQIKDGCMNYLLGGVPTPTMWETDGTNISSLKLPVIWRLIWEDTRYADGIIPEEEAQYFPQEPAIEPVKPRPLAEELLAASTNEKCPRSGEWAVMDDLNAKSFLTQGQKLPFHNGREVTWVWLGK